MRFGSISGWRHRHSSSEVFEQDFTIVRFSETISSPGADKETEKREPFGAPAESYAARLQAPGALIETTGDQRCTLRLGGAQEILRQRKPDVPRGGGKKRTREDPAVAFDEKVIIPLGARYSPATVSERVDHDVRIIAVFQVFRGVQNHQFGVYLVKSYNLGSASRFRNRSAVNSTGDNT